MVLNYSPLNMHLDIVFLICSLALIVGARETVSQNCDQFHDECVDKAFDVVGKDGYIKFRQGEIESGCEFQREYKTCVLKSNDCLDNLRISGMIGYLDKTFKNVTCDSPSGPRELVSQSCDKAHKECLVNAYDVLGSKGFIKFRQGETETSCKFHDEYKNCVVKYKDCTDYPSIRRMNVYLDKKVERLICHSLLPSARGWTPENCVQKHEGCVRKARDAVGSSGFTKFIEGETESTCKFGRAYKNCATQSKDCLEDVKISSVIELLDYEDERLKCG